MGSLVLQTQKYNYDLLCIDGDAIVYRGGLTVQEHEPVGHSINNCRMILQDIRDACPAKSEMLFITANDKSNFRFARATTPRVINKGKDTEYTLQGYKSNRRGNDKPVHYDEIRAWLCDVEGGSVVSGEEADDAMAREATRTDNKAIIATHDKDLNMVCVDIYNIIKKQIAPYDYRMLGELGTLGKDGTKVWGRGLVWFYAQMLMGDTGDNIPGIPGWGPAKAYKALKDCQDEMQLFRTTYDIYFDALSEDHTFQAVKSRYLEVADLLWMRTCNIEDMGLYLRNNYFNNIGE